MKRFRVRIKCTFPEGSREGLAYTTVLEQSKFHQADRTTVENVSILSTPNSPFEDWGKEGTCPLEDIGQGVRTCICFIRRRPTFVIKTG
ncbi:hypothetical protein TNIN_9721 [Trichonephila inaurata madagascariensis]|uniref:Uncharacterized protein n=1 Tax=Trichonephila inaurata madagascariensis TaxID=2747483 RepID=A0A8X7BPZ4_9ARAC|nr:hypothetical protein TNIN_9721 [Trichonephila inaurata madagascariensis]